MVAKENVKEVVVLDVTPDVVLVVRDVVGAIPLVVIVVQGVAKGDVLAHVLELVPDLVVPIVPHVTDVPHVPVAPHVLLIVVVTVLEDVVEIAMVAPVVAENVVVAQVHVVVAANITAEQLAQGVETVVDYNVVQDVQGNVMDVLVVQVVVKLDAKLAVIRDVKLDVMVVPAALQDVKEIVKIVATQIVQQIAIVVAVVNRLGLHHGDFLYSS